MADDTYFEYVRDEIAPLLGPEPKRILEIGCASGRTLEWLKRRWPDAETVGVDGYEPIRAELAKRVDRAVIHDLEQPLPDLGHFDLILALDVLEHLRWPEKTLADLAGRLNPGGAVIVSVPNVAHVSVLAGLLRRRFEYQDAGILDRTHMRFFTEQSALGLMQDAGLTVTDGVVNGVAGRRRRWIDRVFLGFATHYLVEQYIMRGEIAAQPQRWRWRKR